MRIYANDNSSLLDDPEVKDLAAAINDYYTRSKFSEPKVSKNTNLKDVGLAFDVESRSDYDRNVEENSDDDTYFRLYVSVDIPQKAVNYYINDKLRDTVAYDRYADLSDEIFYNDSKHWLDLCADLLTKEEQNELYGEDN